MKKLFFVLYPALVAFYVAWATIKIYQLSSGRERCMEVVEMYHKYVSERPYEGN